MRLLYYTVMQNLDAQQKRKTVFILSLILAVVVLINLSDPLATSAKKPGPTGADQIKTDPTKDFSSLDNYISYSVPGSWQKVDQVDKEQGKDTFIALISPDFEASSSGQVLNGAKIWINRNYDSQAEVTLNNKLNAAYPLYDYNVLSIQAGNKNAMTLHEDYEGHKRFIYVASNPYLWQITIATKDLEDEEKYQNIVGAFLDSIQFRD